MTKRRFTSALALGLALGLAACAVPRQPSGGPRDQTPPALVETEPAAGAVNVAATSVRLTFSEYVDQASFARALAIAPALDGRLRFKWRRRSVEIRLPEALRENTTYVLTLDTNLRDAHNVALKQPLTLAFSTGPVINKGRIAGRVLDAKRGDGLAGFDVLAYAVPDSAALAVLPEQPDYRTQTGDDGRFEFSYLSEQPYFVVAVQDRNRNRRPDATEAFAVPPQPALRAAEARTDSTQARTAQTRLDSTRADAGPRWIAFVQDTIPPVLQRVRPLSSRRLALRFSEAVQLTRATPEGWLLEDSLAGGPVAVRAVYLLPDDPRQVYLLTDSLAAAPHRLRPVAVADSSGNAVRSDTLRFVPAPDADTLRLRFQGFVPAEDPPGGAVMLPPTAQPGVRFNQSADLDRLDRIVTVEDTTGQALAFTASTPDGATYRLLTTPSIQPGQTVTVSVDGRQAGGVDTVYTRAFRRVSNRALGDLSGVAVADDTNSALVVELYRTDGPTPDQPYATTQADTSGRFIFNGLPEGAYRFRAFLDRNGNGRWDGGRILPYRTAEPVTWNTETPSWRARWDSALADTLRINSNF